MGGLTGSLWSRACSGILAFVLIAGPLSEAGPAFALSGGTQEALPPASYATASSAASTPATDAPAPLPPEPADDSLRSEETSPEVVRELKDRRTENSTHFLLSDGTVRAEVTEVPTRFMDAQGEWTEIDPTLIPSSELGAHETAATSVTVTFDRQEPSEAPVTFRGEGFEVGLDMLGTAEEARLTLGDRTVYLGVAEDTDLEYKSTRTGVKETVILKSPAAPTKYRFSLDLEGLGLRRDPFGQFGLYRPGTSVPEMTLGQLLVFDSSQDSQGDPAICTNATMTVEPSGDGKALITYDLPGDWLADPARTYPVMVDPSITVTGPDPTADAYISSASPSSTFGGNDDLRCGYYDSSTGHNRSFVKFSLASIPSDAYVVYSNLMLYLFHQYYVNTATEVRIGRCTSSWSGVTWNTRPTSWDYIASDYPSGRGVWIDPDVTTTVQNWLDGDWSNHGFMLYQTSPDQNTTHWKKFYSSDYSNSSYLPKLVVRYSEPGHTGSAVDKSVYRLGDTVTATMKVNTGWPHDINVIKLTPKGILNGTSTDRGAFKWSEEPPVAPWVGMACPGSEGGYVSYNPQAAGNSSVDLLPSLCYEESRDDPDDLGGNYLKITFRWRINDTYSDVQDNDLSYQVFMGSTNADEAGSTWDSGWKSVDTNFDVAPAKVTSLTVGAVANSAWFRESVTATGALLDDDDYADQGRGSLVATWAPATGALGYRVLLNDGNVDREVGRTFGSNATTFSTDGIGTHPKDTTLEGLGALPAARSPLGSTPMATESREATIVTTQAGTGVVVTDGTYLYVHKKDTFRPGPAAWVKLGSGLAGTQAGSFVATVGASSGRTMMSAFYLDGYVYEGYAVTTRTVEGIWKGASGTDASRRTLTFTKALLKRHDSVEVTSSTQDVMLTAGSGRIVSVQHNRSTDPATFKIREYSCPTSSTTASFVADRSVVVPNLSSFAWLDGAFIADDNLYLIEALGSTRVLRIDMRTWKATGLWTVDGGTTLALASACFEPVSRTVFAGALDKGTMYRYTGPGFNLRDNPKRVYSSTPGTTSDSTDGYRLRVVPFNTAGSDPSPSSNASAWKTLDTRTVRVDQDPRHAEYDLGEVAGSAASVRIDAGARALALDTNDLSISSWGPDAQVTRHYSSAETTSTYLSPGWHFGFEQKLANVSAEATRVVYVDEDQERHTFLQKEGVWLAPNGFVADLALHSNLPLVTFDDEWTLTLKDRTVLRFDDGGRLLSETDSNGQAVVYTYASDAIRITAANEQYIDVSLSGGKATRAEYVAGSERRRIDYEASDDGLEVHYFPDYGEDAFTTSYVNSNQRLSYVEIVGETFSGASARWDFDYGADGRVESATLPAPSGGASRPEVLFSYAYDSSSELDIATVERSATVSGTPGVEVLQDYAANPNGTPAYMTNERVSSEREVRWTYAYSPANEVVEEISPTGKSMSRVFDSRSNVLFEYDEERHINSYEYDSSDRVVKHVDPRGCASYFGYDSAGNLLWSDRVLNDTETATTRLEYDPRGLVTVSRTELSNNEWLTTLNSDFAQNGQPRRTEVKAQRSAEESPVVYSDEPIALSATQTVTSIVTTQSIDVFGQITEQTDAGGLVTMRDAVYSPAGKLKGFADVDGVVTHNLYDALGNLTETSQTVEATGGPSFAEWHRYQVDPYSRVVRESDLGTGAVESTWVEHVFDAAGNEIQTIDSIEGTTTTWYDARGNMVAQWAPDAGTAGAGNLQSASRWMMDADGVELAEVEAGKPDSDAVTKEWRADGLLLKITDADGSWVRYEYDDGGNQTAEVSPTGDGGESAERTYYDVGGRVVRQESSDGLVTQVAYDLADRPTRVFTSRTIESVDSEGNVTESTVEATSSATSYNQVGWTLSSTDSDGITKRSAYDVLGNSIEESVWASGAASPTSVTRFQYDSKKRVVRQAVTENDKENVVSYAYDPFGRVVSEVHSKNGVLSRDVATDYDEFGRETRIEDRQTGVVSRYHYAGGEKKSSTTSLSYGSTCVTATVDSMGRETTQSATLTLPDRTVSVERSVAWDAVRNLPQSATVGLDGVGNTVVAAFDDADRLTSVTGGLWGGGGLTMTYDRGEGGGKGTGAKLSDCTSIPWSGGTITTARTFAFTPSGRVSTVTVGARSISYSWDASGTGDLMTVRDGATTTTYQNKDGHVATATAGTSVTTYEYDSAGRRVREAVGSEETSYTWIGDDSLASWAKHNSSSTVASAAYTYDGDGQRMRAEVFAETPWSAEPTHTVYAYGWDGLTLRWLKSSSAATSATIEYVSYGDGRPYAASYVSQDSAETTAAVFQLMVNDHGDVVALADEVGEVFARYSYGPFGEAEGTAITGTTRVSAALAEAIAEAQPLRYAGYCFDLWSGHYYLQARYYDPAAKQFISKDPAEADGEESPYQYCGGDPIHRADPTGLFGWFGLGRVFRRAQRAVRTVRRAVQVVRSTVRRVTRRVVRAVRTVRTRIVNRAQAARRWVASKARRVKSRVTAFRRAVEKRVKPRLSRRSHQRTRASNQRTSGSGSKRDKPTARPSARSVKDKPMSNWEKYAYIQGGAIAITGGATIAVVGGTAVVAGGVEMIAASETVIGSVPGVIVVATGACIAGAGAVIMNTGVDLVDIGVTGQKHDLAVERVVDDVKEGDWGAVASEVLLPIPDVDPNE